MTAIVQSVLGPMAATQLGRTLCHEHVVVRSPGFAEAYPATFDRTALVEDATRHLTLLREHGVDTILDQTTVDLGRDHLLLAEVAKLSGITIVAATGVHLTVPRWVSSHTAEDLAELFVGDLLDGCADSSVRAGIIKIASETTEVAEPYRTVFQAAALAHGQTGAPVSTHSAVRTRSGLAQARFLLDTGVPPDRILIGHSGDSDDLDYLTALLDHGVFIGVDRFGAIDVQDDKVRMDIVAALVRRGYAPQIMLSHDTNVWSDRLSRRDRQRLRPDWHYQHVPRTVVPGLGERGVGADAIEAMLVANPARFAAWR